MRRQSVVAGERRQSVGSCRQSVVAGLSEFQKTTLHFEGDDDEDAML